jgi:hypothetical protein
MFYTAPFNNKVMQILECQMGGGEDDFSEYVSKFIAKHIAIISPSLQGIFQSS